MRQTIKNPQNQVKTSGCFILSTLTPSFCAKPQESPFGSNLQIQEENDSSLNECGDREMNFRVILTILDKIGK